MRATMSGDGNKRFDLRITHRIGALDLSNILCFKHQGDDREGIEALPDYSRAAILDIVRGQLSLNADAPNWWQDRIEDDWVDDVWKWADDLVRRRFPELY